MANVTGDGVKVRIGSSPKPLGAYVFGVVEPFDVMVSVAVFEPTVVGVNVTLMTQLPPGRTGAVQPVALKEAGSVPDNARLDTVRSANPVLLTVIVLAVAVELMAVATKAVSVRVQSRRPGRAAAMCVLLRRFPWLLKASGRS